MARPPETAARQAPAHRGRARERRRARERPGRPRARQDTTADAVRGAWPRHRVLSGEDDDEPPAPSPLADLLDQLPSLVPAPARARRAARAPAGGVLVAEGPRR